MSFQVCWRNFEVILKMKKKKQKKENNFEVFYSKVIVIKVIAKIFNLLVISVYLYPTNSVLTLLRDYEV